LLIVSFFLYVKQSLFNAFGPVRPSQKLLLKSNTNNSVLNFTEHINFILGLEQYKLLTNIFRVHVVIL